MLHFLPSEAQYAAKVRTGVRQTGHGETVRQVSLKVEGRKLLLEKGGAFLQSGAYGQVARPVAWLVALVHAIEDGHVPA